MSKSLFSSFVSFILLLIAFVVVGCSRDFAGDEVEPTPSRTATRGYVSFSTLAHGTQPSINTDNVDQEDRMVKVRLIACVKSTGEVLHNAVHPLSELTNYRQEIPLPTGEYEFFIIANETSAMTTALDEVTFRDALFQKTSLTQVPVPNGIQERIAANQGMPMTARVEGTITAAHKHGAALKINVTLIRTLAKVTLHLQRALGRNGQPTESAKPLTVKSITLNNLPSTYPLFHNSGWSQNAVRTPLTLTTNVSPNGAQKLTRVFYMPERVRWTGGGSTLQLDFVFTKHGIERTKTMALNNGNKSNVTTAGYTTFIQSNLDPSSVVRNTDYTADIELKGWDEEVIRYNWTILPWEKSSSVKDFTPEDVEISTNPAQNQDGVSQGSNTQGNDLRHQLNLSSAITDRVTLKFKVKAPAGAHYRFSLTNGLDFKFADEAQTHGIASNNEITLTIIAAKPWGGNVRSTELYLTVNGKEVQIVKHLRDRNAHDVGPTKRFLIRQRA